MKSSRVHVALILMMGIMFGCHNRSTEGDAASNSATKTGTAEFERNLTRRPNELIAWQQLLQPTGADGRLFERLDTRETGVDFVVPVDQSHPLKRLYAGSFFCGGVAIGDVNGDELPDMFLVSGPRENRLYCHTGDFQFEDVTDDAGVGGGETWGTGAAMVDIDDDGDLDIYVCNYDSPNCLYVNQGDCRFAESASQFGLDIVDCSVLPAFCDYDGDGDLDCFLLTNRFYREGGFPRDMRISMRNGEPQIPAKYDKYYRVRRVGRTKGEFQRIGRPDLLFRNEGNGTFLDVSSSAGISNEPGYGLSATWWDFDGDGWHDLYVGNDYHEPDRLYHNNGDGTFTNVIAKRFPHTTWFSMGADVGDINNDGMFDLLSVDMSATTHYGQKTTMGDMGGLLNQIATAKPPQYMRNALLLNTGTVRFMEVAYLSGMASTDWSWTARLADFDNDGQIDAFVTNGMTRNMIDSDHSFTFADQIGRTKWDLYEPLPSMPQQNRAYRNMGDLVFHDVSDSWGLDHVGMSFAAATADFDRDGDLDLVVANLDEPVSIYQNRSTVGHRVLIQLRGERNNRWGIGAVVKITTASGEQIRQMVPSTGYLASNEPVIHFGLGDATMVESLTIDWPTGTQQEFQHLAADRVYTITESNADRPLNEQQAESKVVKSGKPPMFRRSTALAGARHVEKEFDDFARQPLLPNKLSQLGPGLAVADVDGNGHDDLFLAGASGQAGSLWLARGEEDFYQKATPAFDRDAASEDMAAIFFDVDSDGDQDLYVVSGGVEYEVGSRNLRDRLYVNDGEGGFTKSPHESVPDIRDSGGPAAAADFDRDGDLDLFVGGRVVPGSYPLPPRSRLLRNDGGRLIDATDEVAPDVLESGMATGAVWSDVNNDGWIDLLVTYEWGPIRLFENNQGQLVDRTVDAKLDQWLGWWNGVAGRDLDGDGDVDFMVTNFGTNTKYHASQESPALLYYGDFSGSGESRLVEAEFEGQTLYPVRGKSCSTSAMPFLGDKFSSFKSFASASLEEIYTPEHLNGSKRFAATTLRSGVLINDGTGRMEFRPLPNLAQTSPGFGVVLTEVDGDRHADAYIVQNFFSPQTETGHMDGGLSLLLRGSGNGEFTPIWPAQSGLVVPGDAKGLAMTDLNRDGLPDFVVGVNDDDLVAFVQSERRDRRLLTVRLVGSAGNQDAIGAQITMRISDGTTQMAEVAAGSGYLSQSTSAVTFGWGTEQRSAELHIRWPDGKNSSHQVSRDQQQITISEGVGTPAL